MRTLVSLTIFLCLAACGGGSSSNRPAQDTAPPTVTAPGDISVVGTSLDGIDATAAAIADFLAAATATDNVEVASLDNDAPATFPVGTTEVTFTATDEAGNSGSASASVTVSAPPDTVAPVVTAPADIILLATTDSGSAASQQDLVDFLAAVTATDDRGVEGPITNDAPTLFPIGATTVTFEAVDAAGNAGTDTAVVTITDATDPEVTAPAHLTLKANGPNGADATEVSLAGFLAGATATDNVAVEGAITDDAPAVFPLGITTVTFTATDAAGNEGTATADVQVTLADSMLLFGGNNGNNGFELWRTDGSDEGTHMIMDINSGGSSNPRGFIRIGDTVYFTADDGIHGNELWISDGSEEGTRLLRDINPGTGHAYPDQLTQIEDLIFFSADDGLTGHELWVTDGTSEGTVMVSDIQPGTNGSDIGYLTAFASRVFFSANDGVNGVELWTSDGTPAGTTMVADISPGANSYPQFFTIFQDQVYFTARTTAEGRELWRTDGSTLGTSMVIDLATGTEGSEPGDLTVFGAPGAEVLMFAAQRNIAEGRELWRTDGTTAGTVLVRDIRAQTSATQSVNSSSPSEFTVIGDTLYFTAHELATGPRLVWKTDGSAVGTQVIEPPPTAPPYSAARFLVALGSSIIFEAADAVAGREMWITDGTSGGTALVRDINSSAISPRPISILAEQYNVPSGVSKPKLFRGSDRAGLISITSETSGRELWKTDGSAAGTSLIVDMNPGTAPGVYPPAG